MKKQLHSLPDIFLRLLLVLPVFLLFGCPHTMVDQMEKMLPPKGYKPVYLKSSQQYTSMLERIEAYKKLSPTERQNLPESVKKELEVLSQQIRFEVLSVDAHNYPKEVTAKLFLYDADGKYISGLAPPKFTGIGDYKNYWFSVIDSCNGVSTKVENYKIEEIREDAASSHAIVFVLDHSGSMGTKRATKLQEALQANFKYIKKSDYIGVIKFDTNIELEVPLSNDRTFYTSKFQVNGLDNHGGGTALFDAVHMAINHLDQKKGSTVFGINNSYLNAKDTLQKSIVLFSDGDDNSSKVKLDSIINYASSKGIAIYPIAYGLTDESFLQSMADYTAGRLYRIYTTKEFPFVFGDIYRRLRGYYKLTYKAPECEGIHTLNVSLKLPELNNATYTDFGIYDKSVFNKFTPLNSITFVDIHFETGKFEVLEESYSEIQKIATSLLNSKSIKIEIRGHTDDVGSEDDNQNLSEQRAKSVKKVLISMGIDPNRMTTKGFGESKPIVPNTTPENRAKNRRTEFVIIDK